MSPTRRPDFRAGGGALSRREGAEGWERAGVRVLAGGGCAARDNPFRVRRVLRLRYRLEEEGWRGLLERLDRLDRRAALVGPEGSGKTTLLEDLEGRLEDRGWRLLRLRLCCDRRRLGRGEWTRIAAAGGETVVTVDGVEQLSWWQRRRLERLSRRAGGLVVTSHRSGRLPTLREHRTSPELLTALVSDLVGRDTAARLEPELSRLFAVYDGNLRDCLRGLYDLWSVPAAALSPDPSPAPPSLPPGRGAPPPVPRRFAASVFLRARSARLLPQSFPIVATLIDRWEETGGSGGSFGSEAPVDPTPAYRNDARVRGFPRAAPLRGPRAIRRDRGGARRI